jgi:hypothetical protein
MNLYQRILFILLLASGNVFGMARAQGDCSKGGQVVVSNGVNSTTRVQRSYVTVSGGTVTAGCTVTVYINGTTDLATLYSDNVGTELANPFTADTSGHWYFYAINRRYDVTMSGAGITSPFTFGDITLFDPSISSLDVQQYGALCDGATDDYAAIQDALDNNPAATINFPNGATCISSDTWVLSSKTPLRNFSGRLVGNGASIYWTNDGTSNDTDANMQHGIGAYNRVDDPDVAASEVAGVTGVQIYGFTMTCPDYGACIFLGNSNNVLIRDNLLNGKSTTFNDVANPRHAIVIDCGINNEITHNKFGNFTVGMVSIIKSGDTATGHVVYTTFPPYSGYFNDSHIITRNFFNGSAAFAILDMGTGSFTNRTIHDNTAGGGPKAWFYATGGGISALITNNWTESCYYGVGVIYNATAGNIPATGTSRGGFAIPHSYIQGVPGQPEHYTLENNQWANITGVVYAEANDSAFWSIRSERINNPTAGVTFWIYSLSSGDVFDFSDDNLVSYIGALYPALSRTINPSVVAFKRVTTPQYALNGMYPTGRVNPSCQNYTISITSGGNWFVNGADQGYSTTALTYQYIYFLDSTPANSVFTGVSMKTTTAFSGSGFTSLAATLGDGVGLGPPAADTTWYVSSPYDLDATVAVTNHAEYAIFKAPQDISEGHMFLAITANQNMNASPLTGTVIVNVCWAVMP